MKYRSTGEVRRPFGRHFLYRLWRQGNHGFLCRIGGQLYSRRGLRLRRRGAYGIHRASGPWCQGLCRKVASLRSGGRRLAVRKTIEYQIGALPRTPFPAAREFPSRGNERYEEKNRGVICFMYYSSIFPFGGWRHHLSPASGGTITRAYCRAIYEESVSRCFILPPEQGEVRRSRIGGGERSEPISRMLIMPYGTESKSRNADFILIAQGAIPQPSARRAVKLKNPPAHRAGPS